MANAPSQRLLAPLTGIRFFGALHVVLFHFGDHVFRTPPAWLGGSADSWWWVALESIRRAGVPSVSMFFMMSGFILAYKYMDPTGQRRVSVRYFMVARLSRFYPIYLTALLLMLPFVRYTPVGQSPGLMVATGLLHACGLQAWVPRYVLTWNNPGWTISIDLFFYVVFVLLAIPFMQRLSNRALLLCGAGFWGVSLAIASLYVVIDPDGLARKAGGVINNYDHYLVEAFWLNLVKFNPAVRLFEIMVGVVAGRIFQREYQAGVRRRGGRISMTAAAIVLVSGALSSELPWVLVHNGMLAPVLALVLYGLAHGGGPLAWLLSRRPIVFLGDAAFAMYILQWPVAAWSFRATGSLPSMDRFTPGYLVGYIAALIATSCLAFVFLERPAQSSLRRLFLKKRPFWRAQATIDLTTE